MKRENVLKIMLVILIGIALISMSTKVFALSDENLDLTDLTGTVNTNTNNTNTDTNTSTNTDTNTNTNTNSNTNTDTTYSTDLPKTGIAENIILVVGMVILGISAVFAYKKVNEYKGI